MAHAVRTRNLGRSRSWRKATVRSLAQALIQRERIRTTRAKAKEAQRLVERLIRLGKRGDLSARRRALSLLGDPRLVHRLFAEIAPRFQSRPGGYTRILHNGYRTGDGARLAVLELVERSVEATDKQPRRKVEPKPRKEPKAPETPKAEPPPGPTAEGQPEPKAPTQPKPHGFLDGLWKFLKGRQEP